MSDRIVRTRYPAGVPSWIELATPDPEAASAFYAGLFGWRVIDGVAYLDDQPVAGLRRGDPGWHTAVAVGDVAAAVQRAIRAGGQVVTGPTDDDAGGGTRLTDPDGAAFELGPEDRVAALVNEPGTWNFSNLHTPDRLRALAFYGAVFGWESIALGFGAMESTMLRLPGYGDHLAELDPGLRERHADPSVPPGFSDAVAWLAQGTPARWEVTFTGDDVDVLAERAAALGGAVTAAPTSQGPTRVAELRDPYGAGFTVSAYTP